MPTIFYSYGEASTMSRFNSLQGLKDSLVEIDIPDNAVVLGYRIDGDGELEVSYTYANASEEERGRRSRLIEQKQSIIDKMTKEIKELLDAI